MQTGTGLIFMKNDPRVVFIGGGIVEEPFECSMVTGNVHNAPHMNAPCVSVTAALAEGVCPLKQCSFDPMDNEVSVQQVAVQKVRWGMLDSRVQLVLQWQGSIRSDVIPVQTDSSL